ncbi:MAG: DUF4428 domain-containing protein [Liquorilactobacillus hordei]|uniref:DUF4428 domain-containing protein n=1 Tax=Liquorilactobacillus hordei TaxID=468911 RepID=UPI0039EB8084
MANYCSICSKKVTLLTPKISFKDGVVCKNCFSKTFLTGSYSDILWAQNKTIDDFEELLKTGKQVDTKAENKARKKANDARHKEAKEFVHNLSDNTKTVGGVAVNSVQSDKRVRKPFGALVCPHCKSANVQVLSNTNNAKKVKKTTSLNIDPLHPLTPFKHNEKVVKKHSKIKVAAAVSTFGASTLVTGGTRSNKSHQYQCRDCGKVWTRK